MIPSLSLQPRESCFQSLQPRSQFECSSAGISQVNHEDEFRLVYPHLLTKCSHAPTSVYYSVLPPPLLFPLPLYHPCSPAHPYSFNSLTHYDDSLVHLIAPSSSRPLIQTAHTHSSSPIGHSIIVSQQSSTTNRTFIRAAPPSLSVLIAATTQGLCRPFLSLTIALSRLIHRCRRRHLLKTGHRRHLPLLQPVTIYTQSKTRHRHVDESSDRWSPRRSLCAVQTGVVGYVLVATPCW